MLAEQKQAIDRLIRKEKVRDFILSTKEWCEQRHQSSLCDITNAYNADVYAGANHFIRQIGRVDTETMQYILDVIERSNGAGVPAAPTTEKPE